MNKWYKSIVGVLLIALLFLPGISLAQTNSLVEGQQPATESKHSGKKHGYKALAMHKDAYMLLLAEKFAPEQWDEWQRTIQEHRQLKAKWKEQFKAMDEADKKQWYKENKKQHKSKAKLYKPFNKAVQSWLDKGNDAELKQLMPKLLEQLQKCNKGMAKKLG